MHDRDPEDMPDEEGYSLVMPFVVTKDAGGDLDPRAFVVGYELGHIAEQLDILSSMNVGAIPNPRYVHTQGIPQLDLIAMRFGFAFTAEPWDVDEDYTYVEFRRADDDATEGDA